MKRYSLFMVILSLILVFGLTQGCDRDNGEVPTEPTAFAVTGVTVSVDPPSFTGTCPKTFNFSGVITANGPGTVTYKWERSDGAIAPEVSITFDAAGSKTVTTTWRLGSDGTRWARLRILRPNEMVSNQASFTLSCVTGRPDLTVTDITLNVSNQPTCYYRNIGNVTAPGGWVLQMYADGTGAGGWMVGSLAPGAEGSKGPGPVLTRPVRVRCVVDRDNTIAEENEGNNERTELFP